MAGARRRRDVPGRCRGPPAPVAAPARDGRSRRAQRLPRRPVGSAPAHVELPRDDDLRHRGGRRGHDRAGPRHPRAGARQGPARSRLPRQRPPPAALGARRRGVQLPHRPPALRPGAADRGGGRHLRRAVGPGRGPPRGDRPPDDGGRPRCRAHGVPARARGDGRGSGCRALPPPRPATAVGGAPGLRAHRDRGRRRAARVGAASAAPAARGTRPRPWRPASAGSVPARCAGRWPASPRSVSWRPRGPEPPRRCSSRAPRCGRGCAPCSGASRRPWRASRPACSATSPR